MSPLIFPCEFSFASCRCRNLTAWRKLEESRVCDTKDTAQAAPTHAQNEVLLMLNLPTSECSEGKTPLRV